MKIKLTKVFSISVPHILGNTTAREGKVNTGSHEWLHERPEGCAALKKQSPRYFLRHFLFL
jgi:hypothetical protein